MPFKITKIKLVISGVATLVLVALASVYFFVVPSLQVGSYKNEVTTEHSKLNDSLRKVIDVQARDAFVKSEVEATVIRNDVKIGTEAIKDFESKLANNKSGLTNFNALPLLDWNSSYRAAKEIKENEQKYVKAAEDYIAEMKAVLAYLEKTASVVDKIKEIEPLINDLNNAVSLDDMAKRLSTVVARYDEIVAMTTKLTPPTSLKELHNFSVAGAQEMGAIIKDLLSATKAGNVNRMTDLAQQIPSKMSEFTAKGNKLNSEFIHGSLLVKLSDKTQELSRLIDTKSSQL
jgi:hypothetical protein